MLKAQVYKDDPHETLVAASLLWGIGHSGSHAVNADGPSTLEPGFAFGQGLGDLPDSLKWLRPIAITGGASLEFPLQRSSTTYFSDPEDGSLELFSTKNDAILHWGFSIQYSTFYVSDRFTGTPRTEEPRQQYVPLIEFAVASPLGPSPAQKTAATANPGLAYVGQTWQFAAEAIGPLDRGAGHGLGGQVQFVLFLDDLVPSVFGKPLFSR
jgi:hypothetical protein